MCVLTKAMLGEAYGFEWVGFDSKVLMTMIESSALFRKNQWSSVLGFLWDFEQHTACCLFLKSMADLPSF